MGKHFHIEVESDHDALVAILAHLNRENVRYAVDRLIERLDALDGDPDLEEIDEREPDDDAKGDVAWSEWHTRGRHKVVERLSGAHEPMACHDGVGMAHEDDEDDDPLEANGDEHDTGDCEDEELSEIGQRWGQYWHGGPGCPISDPTERGGENESGGQCASYGIDQTAIVSEGEAFHDLNGIPLIRVPLPGNDQ